MRGTSCGQVASPRVVGVALQATLDRRVGDRVDPGLGQDSQAVGLTGGLDDPREHQLPEHLVVVGGGVESELVIDPAQRVPQRRHLRGCDLQRAGSACSEDVGVRAEVELELALPAGQPLPGHRLERLHSLGVMGRANLLDVA
jgi:hypothetical protein